MNEHQALSTAPINQPNKKVIVFLSDALFLSNPLSFHEGAQALLTALGDAKYEIMVILPDIREEDSATIKELLIATRVVLSLNIVKTKASISLCLTEKGIIEHHRNARQYTSQDYLIVSKGACHVQDLRMYDHVSLMASKLCGNESIPVMRAYEQLEERLCRPQVFKERAKQQKKESQFHKVGFFSSSVGWGGSTALAIGFAVSGIVPFVAIGLAVLAVISYLVMMGFVSSSCQSEQQATPMISFAMAK